MPTACRHGKLDSPCSHTLCQIGGNSSSGKYQLLTLNKHPRLLNINMVRACLPYRASDTGRPHTRSHLSASPFSPLFFSSFTCLSKLPSPKLDQVLFRHESMWEVTTSAHKQKERAHPPCCLPEVKPWEILCLCLCGAVYSLSFFFFFFKTVVSH